MVQRLLEFSILYFPSGESTNMRENRKSIGSTIGLAMALIAPSALAGSVDPDNPTLITVPFSTTIDVGSSTLSNDEGTIPAPFDDCGVDDQGVFYAFNSGSLTSVDFFAIGEDTEITLAEAANVAASCEGGDGDDDPVFADVGLTQPSGFPADPDINNSELWLNIAVSANTDYILMVGHNSDDNDYDCIAWGITGSGESFADWADETCPAIGAASPTPVPTLPFYGLLALGGLLGLFGARKLKK